MLTLALIFLTLSFFTLPAGAAIKKTVRGFPLRAVFAGLLMISVLFLLLGLVGVRHFVGGEM